MIVNARQPNHASSTPLDAANNANYCCDDGLLLREVVDVAATFISGGHVHPLREVEALQIPSQHAFFVPMSDAWQAEWDIPGTARYLADRGFAKAALQFPDELLAEAASVASALRQACAALGHAVQPFVLADTSYNSLGVDEVAAAHADAQCVVRQHRNCRV